MKSNLKRLFSGTLPSVKLISLVIPVFNEEHHLLELSEVLDAVPWPVRCEWVFVDDASMDRSYEIIQGLKPRHCTVRHAKNEVNLGKGASLARAIAMCEGDIIAIQDADLEYDPNDLLALICPIMQGRADVVYGSRFKRDVKQVHRTFHRYANVFLTCMSNIFSGIYLSDMESCYKVFRADILKSFHLRSKRFGFEPEITAYIAKFSLRLLEFPIWYFPRNYMEGKKIGWRDGIAALWFIFKFNLLVSPLDCLKKEARMWIKEGKFISSESAPTRKVA